MFLRTSGNGDSEGTASDARFTRSGSGGKISEGKAEIFVAAGAEGMLRGAASPLGFQAMASLREAISLGFIGTMRAAAPASEFSEGGRIRTAAGIRINSGRRIRATALRLNSKARIACALIASPSSPQTQTEESMHKSITYEPNKTSLASPPQSSCYFFEPAVTGFLTITTKQAGMQAVQRILRIETNSHATCIGSIGLHEIPQRKRGGFIQH